MTSNASQHLQLEIGRRMQYIYHQIIMQPRLRQQQQQQPDISSTNIASFNILHLYTAIFSDTGNLNEFSVIEKQRQHHTYYLFFDATVSTMICIDVTLSCKPLSSHSLMHYTAN